MQRNDMIEYLGGLDKNDRYPLWIISYNRAGKAPLLNTIHKNWERKDDIHVVVRDSQRASYERAYPEFVILSLPDDEIDAGGKARWGAVRLAQGLGEPVISMFDDDVLALRFLFLRHFMRGANVGKPCSGHSTLEDEAVLPDLGERVVGGFHDVARTVIADNPDVVIGGMIKQHMSFDVKNHQLQYILNGGVTPRQAMVWHIERMAEKQIELNLDHFGLHGDDIGIVVQALANGGDSFAVPSFAYEHWPESINIKESVVRNAGNKQQLHEIEWAALQEYPAKDYLRVKRSIIDGSYEWGDINWVACAKKRGRPTVRVPWAQDAAEYFSAELL